MELIRDPAVGRESEGQGLAVVDDGVERKPGQDGMEAEIGHGEATVKDVLVRILQRV